MPKRPLALEGRNTPRPYSPSVQVNQEAKFWERGQVEGRLRCTDGCYTHHKAKKDALRQHVKTTHTARKRLPLGTP